MTHPADGAWKANYDDGYGDEQPASPNPLLLYVMGAIDELRAIGIIEEIAGDKPLTNHKERKRYRALKKSGYKPTLEEVERTLSRCVCADDQQSFRVLFQGIIEKGWDEIKRIHAENKASDARDAEIRRIYGYPDGWIPL